MTKNTRPTWDQITRAADPYGAREHDARELMELARKFDRLAERISAANLRHVASEVATCKRADECGECRHLAETWIAAGHATLKTRMPHLTQEERAERTLNDSYTPDARLVILEADEPCTRCRRGYTGTHWCTKASA